MDRLNKVEVMYGAALRTIFFTLLLGLTINAGAQIKTKPTNVMKDHDYTTSFLVDESPDVVFNAISKVRSWWSEQIEGRTDHLNAKFDYHYKDIHRAKFRITEYVPGKKVVWLVVDNHFNFTKDPAEWKGTQLSFEIKKAGAKTQLTFTHIGLVPAYECYSICSDAWANYINGSLKKLIETGKGNPNPYETAIKSAETMKGGGNE